MRKKYSFFILCFSILLIMPIFSMKYQHVKKSNCHKSDYSFSVFALSWIGEFCSQKTCSSEWKDIWDGASFTIHGYWPSGTDKAILDCQRINGYDKFCFKNYTFDDSKIQTLNDDLNRIWPQVGPKKSFWQYQWDKHGTCYLQITQDSYNSQGLSEDDIFFKFFEGAIQKYNDLGLTGITKFKYNSKDQFAQQFGLEKDQFILTCGNDNELDQLRVCYSLNEPENEQIIDCPSRPKECTFPIVLKSE